MSEYINETARAYLTVFRTLPSDVQVAVKKMINEKSEKQKIDFSLLATKGWQEKAHTYSREELYD
jgi:hypothetical protein